MAGWRSQQPKKLKKIAFALTRHTLARVIGAHEERGWVQASEVQKHGYGFGCLMTMNNKKRER